MAVEEMGARVPRAGIGVLHPLTQNIGHAIGGAIGLVLVDVGAVMIDIRRIAVGVLARDGSAADRDRGRWLAVGSSHTIERIIERKRNDNLRARCLADEVEAVVEELAEQRGDAVECRNAWIGGADVDLAIVQVLRVVAAIGANQTVIGDDRCAFDQFGDIDVLRIGCAVGRTPGVDHIVVVRGQL